MYRPKNITMPQKSLNIIPTADGSYTLIDETLHETYHSRHGAQTESLHVFIQSGLEYVLFRFPISRIHILEIGFGTGLNALLTITALRNFSNIQVTYTALEPFLPNLNWLYKNGFYGNLEWPPDLLDWLLSPVKKIYTSPDGRFTLHLREEKWPEAVCNLVPADLIFYDAFAPQKQSEMWSEEALKAAWEILKLKGVLVTYAAQGKMRRLLQQIGFSVESLPGPPGKREMTRAVK